MWLVVSILVRMLKISEIIKVVLVNSSVVGSLLKIRFSIGICW